MARSLCLPPSTESLNSTTYSTVSINLAAPGIPFTLPGAPDGDFDLYKIMGWAVSATKV